MATNELVTQPVRAIGDRLALEQSFCINATRSVNADRQRVFHALTVPEYIETWFSAPGALAGRTVETVFIRHWERGHLCLHANGPSKAKGNGLPHKSSANRE
jgi:hypothetical protein